MLTMFIKTYCVNVAVNIKPIYLNEHVFSHVSLQLKRKIQSFIAKKMLKMRFKKFRVVNKSIFQ